MLFVVIYLVEKGETAFFSPEPERKEQAPAPAKSKKKKSPRKERTN